MSVRIDLDPSVSNFLSTHCQLPIFQARDSYSDSLNGLRLQTRLPVSISLLSKVSDRPQAPFGLAALPYKAFPSSRNGRPGRRFRSMISSGTPLVSGTKRKQKKRPANDRTE